MTQLTTERYAQICRAFVKLADKFQKLDVDHMTLKSKVAQILKLLKNYQTVAEKLNQENQVLKQELQTVTAKYEALQLFEFFLEPEFQALLEEAEAQCELVDETLEEMEDDCDPDLDELDKRLLSEYQTRPDSFVTSETIDQWEKAVVA